MKGGEYLPSCSNSSSIQSSSSSSSNHSTSNSSSFSGSSPETEDGVVEIVSLSVDIVLWEPEETSRFFRNDKSKVKPSFLRWVVRKVPWKMRWLKTYGTLLTTTSSRGPNTFLVVCWPVVGGGILAHVLLGGRRVKRERWVRTSLFFVSEGIQRWTQNLWQVTY